MADELRSVDDILTEALRISPGKTRTDYLDEACRNDPELRQRLDRSLSACVDLDRASTAARVEPPPFTEKVGGEIGPYKLREQIGEGGFGVVYAAEQEKPVRRKVALKVIKPGMDSKEVIVRFEAERQALALMDHPNIAKVLDAGSTENGRPYFVMELVRGIPITEYCDRRRLGTRTRLGLFVAICQAIQHAHQKGVIHRDVKPSNVLVTEHDGTPLPKVIDFGVAKAINQRLTEKTIYTRHRQMVGTPLYMSPEQAELSAALDVDTRSDVYSLGVLLYELLTGTTPFDRKRFREEAYDEIRRIIQEEDPPKPSTRISTLGDSAATITERRKTDPNKLRHVLSGDLDWIVMKCLEKDRNRRYDTANGLAMDIRRYMDSEPIAARPPSTWYRFQKLARRNKVAYATTTAVFLALAVGLCAAVLGLSSAQRQRQVAQDERGQAQQAQRIADEQRNMADDARSRAEQLRKQAANRADQLARQNYLIHLANADQALLEHDYVRGRVELNACADDQRAWEHAFLNERIRTTIAAEFPGSEKPIYTRDGKLIAIGVAGSQDEHKALVWDLVSKRRIDELEHESKLICLALSPDEAWLVGGAFDGELVQWNLQTGKKKWSVKKHRDRFDGMAFSPDGSLIATANWDGILKVFDAATGGVKLELPFDDPLRKVMFSPDGRWIVAGFNFDPSGEPPVLIDLSNGMIAARFPDDGHGVPTFSPDGQRVATGTADGRITLWTWDGNQLIEETSWQSGNSRLFDLEFNADATRLVSSSRTYSVKVWHVATRQELASFDAGAAPFWLAMSPKRDEVAIFTSVHGIRLWRYTGHNDGLTVRPFNDESPSFVKLSPDGQRIAVVRGVGGELVILDAESGNQVRSLPIVCRHFAWVPDSRHVVVCSEPQLELEMYNVLTGAFVRRYQGLADRSDLYVDQTGRTLMSIGDSTVRIWELLSSQPRDEFQLGTGWLLAAAVTRHGQLLATTYHQEHKVEIWDAQTKRVVNTVPTPGRWPSVLTFTNDGRQIYVGSDGGRLTLHDIESEQEIGQFTGHTGWVRALAANPVEQQIVSSDQSGRIIVWDVASTQPLFTLLSDTDTQVVSLDWNDDNRRIVAGKDDGTVQIWTLPTGP